VRKQELAGAQIEDELLDTLATLAGGRPVLIDLAVDLGARIGAAAVEVLGDGGF